MVHPISYACFFLLTQFSLSEALSWPHRDHAPLLPRQGQREAPLNATGRVSFRGYDVSKPWPSSEDKSDNWSLNLQVRDDVGIRFSNQTKTEIMISFSGPEYLERDKMDPSWSICQGIYRNAGFLNDTGKPIDPTCKGVLSESCMTELRKAAADTRCKTFARDAEMEKCPELLEGSAAGSLTDINSTYVKNQTTIHRSNGLLVNVPHDMGNYTQYDETIRQITVVVTAFNRNPKTADDGEGYAEVNNNVHLSCLAVDAFQPNSRSFEASASTLSRVGVLSGLAAVVVLVLHSVL